jgi:hypothetical protein
MKVTALERKQQPQRHDFTGTQVGLQRFGQSWYVLVYPIEPFNDKVLGGHGFCASPFGDFEDCTMSMTFSTSTNG